MTDFVLNRTGFVKQKNIILNISTTKNTVFVLNITGFDLAMTGYVLNYTGFVLIIARFVLMERVCACSLLKRFVNLFIYELLVKLARLHSVG